MTVTEISISTRGGVCVGPGPCDTEPLGEGKNWVTERGGLDPYTRAIAHALKRERGMTESQAVATAIAAVKHWAAGGGKVSDAARARAQKAVAHWEAMKGSKGGRSVDEDNAAYHAGKADRAAGRARLTAAQYRAAHPDADGDDYPLYQAGYAADRDDLELKLEPTGNRALEALASLDIQLAVRDMGGVGGVAEWGAAGPPNLDPSGSGSLLPVAQPRKPKPRQAKLIGDELQHHKFKGTNLQSCSQCGRPVSAEVHKRPKA